jgi:hypothetical protein
MKPSENLEALNISILGGPRNISESIGYIRKCSTLNIPRITWK